MSLPTFLVIGAMKAATTTLHEQLAAQPGIFMTDPKEPCFFSDDDIYARGIDWYEALFTGAGPDDLRGESSTHYTKLPEHPSTVGRIVEHVSDVKTVYVMRHPVDRLISHHVHLWTMREAAADIEIALDTHPELVSYGCYATQLRPYLDALGPERVLPVFFDRLMTQPEAELLRVCAFLGYDDEARWRHDLGAVNASAERLRASRLRDAARALPSFDRLRPLVPQRLVDAFHRRLRLDERPRLSEASRARVQAHFDVELAELGCWLGTPLDCERFSELTAVQPLSWDLDAVPRP